MRAISGSLKALPVQGKNAIQKKDTVIASRQTAVSGFTAYGCVVARLRKQSWQSHLTA
ncbi:MAG: hypothetical protein J6W29_05420 [Neisseriaceae bacterium]|nr:hypothetical protein [Neisseriaceae bacterium]